MKKPNLKALIQQNTARDLRDAARPHAIDSRIAGTVHAPRDITKPIAGAAREIPLALIEPDPNQPRKTMSPEGLEELAASIREVGVIQPINVTWSEESQHYSIVAGHRRLEAAKKAGLATVPAIIKPDTYNDEQRRPEALIENLQREDIPPVEAARAIQQLMDLQHLSQRQVAKKVGKTQTYIAELLQILRLPDDLLSRATTAPNFPKRALVEASREKTYKDQAELIDAGLSSKTPFQRVKATRAARATEKQLEHFKETYQVEGIPGTVTVSFDKPPRQVTPDQIANLLRKTVRLVLSRSSRRK